MRGLVARIDTFLGVYFDDVNFLERRGSSFVTAPAEAGLDYPRV